MIVIDEVHTVVGSTGFRKTFDSISRLMSLKVPIVFVTATQAPHLQSEYEKALKLPRGYKMIRAATNRPEHQYILFSVEKKDLLRRTFTFIHQSSQFLHGTRRAIVFVRSKEFGRSLKKIFSDLDFISSDVKSDTQRSKMMTRWIDGSSGGWIIGTSSLIQGVDYHDVHLVVFADSPFGMVDFVQGAGRAGRNGSPARIVMLSTGTPILPSPGDTVDLGCKRHLARWLEGGTCRRVGISECMDENSVTCTTLSQAIPCDICDPGHELLETWDRVTKLEIEHLPEMPRPDLSSDAPGAALDPVTLLPIVPLRPRVPSLQVLQHSLNELALEQARISTAVDCIKLLVDFAPNCGICNGRSMGKRFTGELHEKWNICAKSMPKHERTGMNNVFGQFYDWNKPKISGIAVSRLAYILFRC